MKLIAGLGNPGRKYDQTKHNTGFMALDHYLEKNGLTLDKDKFEGLWTKQKINGEDVIFLEPQTFMNDSGKSIAQVANFFKIKPEDILVIHDDMDMPTGKLRLRQSGSAGGHNGMKSIIAHVGTQNFKRIRVGIDKHAYIPVVDYVLGRFTKEQQPLIEKGIQDAKEAVITILDKDFTAAMNAYN